MGSYAQKRFQKQESRRRIDLVLKQVHSVRSGYIIGNVYYHNNEEIRGVKDLGDSVTKHNKENYYGCH